MFFVTAHVDRFAVVQPADHGRPVLVAYHDTEAKAQAEADSLNAKMCDYGADATPPDMSRLLEAIA